MKEPTALPHWLCCKPLLYVNALTRSRARPSASRVTRSRARPDLEGRPYTENAYTALTYTKTGFHGHQAISRTHRRFHVHTGVFTIFTFFHVHSWFFHVHLHTFSRTYFGFHVHLLFSRPLPVFTYTPSFSSSFGQTDFGRIFRVQMAPQGVARSRARPP